MQGAKVKYNSYTEYKLDQHQKYYFWKSKAWKAQSLPCMDVVFYVVLN